MVDSAHNAFMGGAWRGAVHGGVAGGVGGACMFTLWPPRWMFLEFILIAYLNVEALRSIKRR